MGKIKLPYIHSFRAKGRTYYYYRRAGIQQRLPGEPGSVEFHEAYQRIHHSFECGHDTTAARAGSFEALVQKYYRSPEFLQLKKRTRAEYRSYLEPMRGKFGDLNIRGLSRRVVLEYRDTMQTTPAKANHAVKALRLLLNFAVNREWLKTNPASGIESLKTGPGWQPWPKASIERAHERLTGSSRIAFMLALYTGQRKGDILRMRWDDIQDNGIRVCQSKTGTPLLIPIDPTLAHELSKIERKGLAIVSRRDGRPYTGSGFNRIWQRQQKKHGFKGLPFHGLRKNATVALFEAGCTPQEVQAITGHSSLEMVEHYGKGARQKLLAERAMHKRWTASGKLTGKPANDGGG